MSDYGVDIDAAAELIATQDGLENDSPTAPTQATREPEAATVPPQGNEPDDGTTATDEADSFTNIDPSSLPPELLAQYRNMQADYTKGKQQVAEMRRELDGLDPTEARGALEFVQALNSDPDFAVQVHQQLSQALENAGLSRAEASRVAANELSGAADEGSNWQDEGVGVPPEVLQRIERTEQFMQDFERRQQEQQVTAMIDRQESEIRKQYPDWDQADIDSVYKHAFAVGGDLMKGAEAYLQDQARIMSRMVNQTKAHPTGQPRQTGTGHALPNAPKSLKEATAAGTEMLLRSFE